MSASSRVTIGIPTFQRAGLLERTLRSAREQDWENLRIVISDNASDDETDEICRAAAIDDPRIQYLRAKRNRGPTANFNRLFAECTTGDFALMLADDDRLAPGYVTTCVGILLEHPELALVAGRARYMRGDSVVELGTVHRHIEPDAAARVLGYLSTVRDNGIFYGVVRGEVLRRAGPMDNVLGNDWLHVARIAAQGGILTTDATHIERELDGTSVDVGSILRTFGRSGWQARVPQLVIASEILRDIAAGGEAYTSLSPPARGSLAVQAALESVRWPDLAWHLVTPTVAQLARRRRGRPIWENYLRMARALGAGRSGASDPD